MLLKSCGHILCEISAVDIYLFIYYQLSIIQLAAFCIGSFFNAEFHDQ